MEAARVATVLISGLYAGGVVVYMVVLPPLFAQIPAEHGVRVKRRIDPLNDKFWPPFLIATMVLAVVLLVFDDAASGTATALTAVGLVCLIAVPVITRGLVIPVNRQIHELPADATDEAERRGMDEAFRSLHRRWGVLHAVRMAVALAAFAAFTIALALG